MKDYEARQKSLEEQKAQLEMKLQARIEEISALHLKLNSGEQVRL